METLVQPDYSAMEEFFSGLRYALDVLENETLKRIRDNLTRVKTNLAQCEALTNVYEAGVQKIVTLVQRVLGLREGPSTYQQLKGGLESISLLLLSLAEIERCMQGGECFMLRCAELLDSDISNGSLSKMTFILLREFSFSLDLVQVVVNILMFKHIGLEHDNSENPNEWRILAAELFNYCRPFDLFEWCQRRCRPVLKQCFLDLGQELWGFRALVSEDAFKDQGHLHHPHNKWEADLASVLEEPSVQPSYLLPLKIDYQDVQDQKYLGKGSFGTVFRCKWHHKDMVVKIIKLDPEELEFERRFEMEVSILASFQHPNTVQTFGFGYTEGRAEGFYVMEQMQTDLSNIIREMRMRRRSSESHLFPIDVCMEIMSQIVEGMCALRLQRVIHRDLKPANILVNRPDESMKPFEPFYHVKLADFGSSKVPDGSNSVFSTVRVGTPGYMAPEVMSATVLPEGSGQHGYSWKADVYSFAMVCSEMLTGERPFQHLNGHIANTLAAVRGGERPSLPLDGGDFLKRLIEDCWKLNSEERPDVWEVRRRLWECRVYHFFMMKKLSTSWQMFRTRLDSRRASIESNERIRTIFSRISFISGNTARNQGRVVLVSSRGRLELSELIQNVISKAQPAVRCKPVCSELADQLAVIKRTILEIETTLMGSRRLTLADEHRLRGVITRLGNKLKRLADLLHEAAVGVHLCNSTTELFGLFNSQLSARILSLYDDIREIAGSRPGSAVMPTRVQVSAAMDRIEFDPMNLHVAVCGTSGSGMSSLINAFRSLRDNAQDPARVGITECTSEITRYPRPHRPGTFGSFSQLVWYDIPGGGTMAAPDRQYFNDQGLFVFDAIVMVYDERFTTLNVNIMKNCLQFNIPVFIVRTKADQHVANMMRCETRTEPGGENYNLVYKETVVKYVEATSSDFNKQMQTMAADPEIDDRGRQLLLSKRVYVVSTVNDMKWLRMADRRILDARILGRTVEPSGFDETLLVEALFKFSKYTYEKKINVLVRAGDIL